MTLRPRRRTDHREMPWRNGGGTTLEVARSPRTDDVEFDWRVSFAHVEGDGPFSSFVGVDRLLVLVEGEVMRLTVDGEPRELRPCAPFAFAGETPVMCRVPSPTWDLNVMTRRGAATATMTCHDLMSGPIDVETEEGTITMIAALSGRPVVDPHEGAPLDLDPFDVLDLDGLPVVVQGMGVVAIIRIGAAGTR